MCIYSLKYIKCTGKIYDMKSLYIVYIYTNCILWTLSDNKVYLILSYLLSYLKGKNTVLMYVCYTYSKTRAPGLTLANTHPPILIPVVSLSLK